MTAESRTLAADYDAAVAETNRCLAALFEATTGRPLMARPLPVAATWGGA
jgi:hypothetical protein